MDLLGKLGDAVREKMKNKSQVSMASEISLTEVAGRISTGCTPLDCIIGGGIPRGRITEILGPPHEGKSTLVEHLVKSCQDEGGVVMLMLSEACIDKDRMKRIGIKLDKLLLNEVGSLEDGFDCIFFALKQIEEHPDEYKKVPILIAWDTISAAPNRHELEQDRFGGGIAYTPRVIREGLRSIEMSVARARAAVVFACQTIQDIGSYAGGEDSPGGGGLKFNSSLRMFIKKKTVIQDPNTKLPLGIESRVYIRKSRVAPPRREIIMPIYDWNGIDDAGAMYFYLQTTHFTTAGGWHRLKGPDGKQIQFRWADYHKVISQPGMMDYLRAECKKVYEATLPSSVVDESP